MTRKTFYARLRRAKNKFRWSVDCGLIRADDELNREFCPITALFYDETQEYVNLYSVGNAQRKLLLDVNFSRNIISAADNQTKVLDYKTARTRKTILRALALREEEV